MRSRTIAIAALALVLATAAVAQKGQVSPETANACAVRLAGEIKWHDTLESTLADAAKEDKLGFYMHMVGKIGGDT
jgi:hypothetical protein